MIGAGIFTTSGLLLAGLHDPLLMMGLWLAGGIIAFCGALSYGELGAAMPEAGGEYLFLSRIFHPVFGFLSGWVSFIVGFSAPIAASAIGFSSYFFQAFPGAAGWLPEFLTKDPDVPNKLFSVIIILLFTGLHSVGLKAGARVQNVLTVVKVVLVVGLIGAGLASGKGDLSHFTMAGASGAGTAGFKTIGLSLMWIMFAYSGWNASTYIGSEIRNPGKNLPASLLAGTGIVILLYLLLNLVFVYAVPPAEMEGVIPVGGLAAEYLFGAAAGRTFSLLIAFALFSSLSAFIIIGPRVYYSMARDGLFFKPVARVHPRFGVPSVAIWLQGAIAVLFTLTGTFDQILTYMGFSLGIFPILTIAALFKLRIQGKIPVKMPGYPVVQIIYLVAGTLILVLSFLERPVESGIALATTLIGLPVYHLFKKM
jgi:APA family basic amino acid/polyamine antiporter